MALQGPQTSPKPFQFVDLRAAMSSSPKAISPCRAPLDPFSDLPEPEYRSETIISLKKTRQPRARATSARKEKKATRAKSNGEASITSQKKLSKGRVTKPTTAVASKKSLPTDVDAIDPSCATPLVAAVKRRLDWTPPKDSQYSENLAGEEGTTPELHGLVASSGLFEHFQHVADSRTAITPSESTPTEFLSKRKKLELNSNVQKSASKRKARKAATKATVPELVEAAAPIVQYFSKKTNAGLETNDIAGSRSRTKTPGRSRAKAGGSAAQPILLSPGSALKATGNQSFVFGTSSQLAQETSPRVLRQLHMAMTLSNKIENDVHPLRFPRIDSTGSALSAKMRFFSTKSKTSLWTAGARDIQGDLLEVEEVDLTDSPVTAPLHLQRARSPGEVLEARHIAAYDVEDSAVSSNSTTTGSSGSIFGKPSSCTSNMTVLTTPDCSIEPRPSVVPANHSNMDRSAQERASERQITDSAQVMTTTSSKPDYSNFTTLQLSRELASYSFKPVKGREKMIALLDKCWEAKHRAALESIDANAMHYSQQEIPKAGQTGKQQDSAGVTKRPRGRPRKVMNVQEAGKVNATGDNSSSIEILSSDAEEVTATPRRSPNAIDIERESTPTPRRRGPGVKTPSMKPSVSVPESIEDSEASDGESATESKIELFRCMTRAVMSAPRSNNHQQPSWHEKILMYDPIVLEDLTTWLNTGALDKAGWDGEVWPGLVKEWCESKSICCLWRENLRGLKRKCI